MKLLFINHWIHDKNKIAIKSYKNITEVSSIDDIHPMNLTEYDCVYSPSHPINVKQYPKMKFIFGPHFSVFPDYKIQHIEGSNSVYIQPSQWAADVWINSGLCDNLTIKPMPFAVDTETFKEIYPLEERYKVFIYFKQRNSEELNYITNFLISKNIEYHIFSYQDRYNQDDYIDYLHQSKYGIWLGRHESQGFALEEALSCNVPLLVWDVTSMNQEVGQHYSDIPATAIPYWDERCGESFYNESQIEETFTLFLSKIETYQPREYVLENLSIDICEQKLIDIVNSITI